jgi:hypothetical protein
VTQVVLLELLVHKVQLEYRVFKEHLAERQVQLGRAALLDLQEILVEQQAHADPQVLQVLQDRLEPQVLQDQRAPQVPQVPQALL